MPCHKHYIKILFSKYKLIDKVLKQLKETRSSILVQQAPEDKQSLQTDIIMYHQLILCTSVQEQNYF